MTEPATPVAEPEAEPVTDLTQTPEPGTEPDNTPEPDAGADPRIQQLSAEAKCCPP
jgi:hypothetical protein